MEIRNMMVDPAKEQAGVWVDYDDKTKFLIGSLSSRRYKQAYQEELDENRSRARRNPETAEKMQNKVFARAIVLDWQGVEMQGQNYPCTPENVEYVLANCPQVKEFIVQAAANYDNFKVDKVEEAKAALGER